MAKIIERGLARDGRRVRLALLVPDRPGSLARVAALVGEEGAACEHCWSCSWIWGGGAHWLG